MRAAANFQASCPRDRIGTNIYATTVPIIVATAITKSKSLDTYNDRNRQIEMQVYKIMT